MINKLIHWMLMNAVFLSAFIPLHLIAAIKDGDADISLNNFIALCDAEDYVGLLESSNNTNEENRTMTFVNSFQKIILSQTWHPGDANYNTRNRVILNDVLSDATDITNVSKSSTKLELSITIVPAVNISKQVADILQQVLSANFSLLKIPVNLYLFAGIDHLNYDMVTLLHRDIQTIRNEVNRFPSISTSVGITINAVNCERNPFLLQTLPTRLLDSIIFHVSDSQTETQDEELYKTVSSDVFTSFQTCSALYKREHSLKLPKIGFVFSERLTSNSVMFNVSQWFLRKVHQLLGNDNIDLYFPVILQAKDTSSMGLLEQPMSPKIGQYWIKSKFALHKEFIRAPIYFDCNKPGIPMALQNAFSIFPKVLIENLNVQQLESSEDFAFAIYEAARLKRRLLTRAYEQSYVAYDPGPYEVGVNVNVPKNFGLQNISRITKQTLFAARRGNMAFPNTVTGLTFNVIGGIEVESLLALFSIFHQEISKYVNSTDTNLPRVGFMIPSRYCMAYAAAFSLNAISNISEITFSAFVTINNFTDITGLSAQVLRLFKICKSKYSNGLAEIGNRSLIFSYYVGVNDCLDRTINTTPELLQHNRFLYNLNKWATHERSILTVRWDGLTGNKFYNDCGTKAATTAMPPHCPYTRHHRNVPYAETDCREYLLWILIPSAVFLMLFTASTTFRLWRYRRRYNAMTTVTTEDADTYFVQQINQQSIHAPVESYRTSQYELTSAQYTIDHSNYLGVGSVARVVVGTINRNGITQRVAVKQLLEGRHLNNKFALIDILKELKILSYLGTHNHVVRLEGADISGIRRGQVLLFLELCQLGSLEKYLHQVAKETETNPSYRIYENITPIYENVGRDNLQNIIRFDLNRWSLEIADGMEFLHSKNVLHCDLAARNVLLTVEKTAKLTDFGISKRVYEYAYYTMKTQRPVPWRWMAPQSLQKYEFSVKTDVWAYGITLWELYSLGDMPYSGFSWDMYFVSQLENGVRCGEPRYKDERLYSIMQRCWEFSSKRRPTFSMIKYMIQNDNEVASPK